MHPLSPALQARRIVGQEPDAGKKLGARRDIVKPRSVGEELLGHAQIFSGVAPQDIAGLRGLLPQIEGRGGVALEKGAEAAGVVVVPVGEDGGVHTGQIDAQPGGVVQQRGGRAGIQQDAASPVLNHEGEAVLTEEPLRGGVLHQNRYPHGAHSPFLLSFCFSPCPLTR